jgi:hypothetical protein
MDWSDDATAIVEELLRELPAPVRESVHAATHTRAEAVTSEVGEVEVSMETAVRSFIEATPLDLRERLKHGLNYHGIDPDEYESAFLA